MTAVGLMARGLFQRDGKKGRLRIEDHTNSQIWPLDNSFRLKKVCFYECVHTTQATLGVVYSSLLPGSRE